jgi:hypothetical protein
MHIQNTSNNRTLEEVKPINNELQFLYGICLQSHDSVLIGNSAKQNKMIIVQLSNPVKHNKF